MFKMPDAARASSPRARRFPSVAQRLAWRDVLAHRGRSLLVAVLIGLPVAGVVAGVTLAASGYPTPQQRVARQLGQAQASLTPGNVYGDRSLCPQTANGLSLCSDERRLVKLAGPPAAPSSAVPPGYRTLTISVGRAKVQRSLSDGQKLPTEVLLKVVDAASPDVAGRWDLAAGSYPTGASVLVSRTFSRDFAKGVGDTIETPKGVFTIAGVLSSPTLWDATVFASPNHPLAVGAAEDEVLLFGERPFTMMDVAAANQAGVFAYGRQLLLTSPRSLYDDLGGQWFTATVLIGSLAMVLITFVAGSAFAIGVRSSRRQLGLLGAVGAPTRTLRRITLWNAIWIAGLGTLAGLAVGLVGGASAVAAVATTDRSYPIWGLNITPGGVAIAACLGIASGLLAAIAPTLWVGKVDALEAVRSPEGQAPPARIPFGGLIVLALGGVAYAAATVLAQERRPGSVRRALITACEAGIVVALVLGTVLCLAPAISGLARLAPRRPLAMRVVLRDLDRHRGRVVPAVGAVLTAATLASALMTLTQGELAAQRAERVWLVHPMHVLLSAQDGPTAQPRDLTAAANAVDALLGVTATSTKLVQGSVVLEVPESNRCPDQEFPNREDWRCVWPVAMGGAVYQTVVGGPSELQVLLGRVPTTAETDALASGVVLTTQRAAVADGQVLVLVIPADRSEAIAENEGEQTAIKPIPHAGLLMSVPDGVAGWSFMSPETAKKLGIVTYPGSLVLDVGRRVTADENDRLQARLASLGVQNVALPRDPNRPEEPIVWAVLGVATLLVLMVAGLTTALAVADGVRDESTLAAIGAPPKLRKATTAAHLAVVVFLGCVVGSAVGVALVKVLNQFGFEHLYTGAFAIPWTHLAVLILGVPAVGAAVAWVVTPASKALARRRD